MLLVLPTHLSQEETINMLAVIWGSVGFSLNFHEDLKKYLKLMWKWVELNLRLEKLKGTHQNLV